MHGVEAQQEPPDGAGGRLALRDEGHQPVVVREPVDDVAPAAVGQGPDLAGREHRLPRRHRPAELLARGEVLARGRPVPEQRRLRPGHPQGGLQPDTRPGHDGERGGEGADPAGREVGGAEGGAHREQAERRAVVPEVGGDAHRRVDRVVGDPGQPAGDDDPVGEPTRRPDPGEGGDDQRAEPGEHDGGDQHHRDRPALEEEQRPVPEDLAVRERSTGLDHERVGHEAAEHEPRPDVPRQHDDGGRAPREEHPPRGAGRGLRGTARPAGRRRARRGRGGTAPRGR